MANLRRFAIFLYRIMILENEKDYISNGFSEGAKLKIRGFDKIRKFFKDGDVNFHDAGIKSVNMNCDGIKIELDVAGDFKGVQSDGENQWLKYDCYRISLFFDGSCLQISLNCEWLLDDGIIFCNEASFFETDNGFLVFDSGLGTIWCREIEILDISVIE